MSWHLVRMSNGLFARFSETANNFTHYNMTKEMALNYCKKADEGASDYANRLVLEATSDDVPGLAANERKRDGLNRWREALKSIEQAHGKDTLIRTLREMRVRVTG